MAFGVAWRVTSTASAFVQVPKVYRSAVELDSLGKYLRPMLLTATRTGTDPSELLTSNEYFGSAPSASIDYGDAPARRASTRPRWVVSAILLTEARRMAVLNDSVVLVGALLPGGARVVAIESDHVVLQESGGARRVVSLNR
ncbi:MAG TPA: hypothetical protein VMY38_06885 [Gemmatimonadaceae bacterium]|nr:hypothetical protein [Gemmatimonadaceae bacterium]